MDAARLALSLAAGFVIGYIHTSVAIVMLFRPHREIRFLGLRFQGMIPRRKAEIARSVARIVSSDLLKQERVAQRLGGPEARSAFEGLAMDLVARYAESPLGSLRTLLGERAAAAVDAGLGELLREVGRAAGRWAATPGGSAACESAIDGLLSRSLEDLLPGEESEVRRQLAAKGLELLASGDLEEQLRHVFRAFVERARCAGVTLGSLLPREVAEALRRALRECVPAVLLRFDDALLAPQNVDRIKGAVRSGVRAYLMETGGGVLKNVVRRLALLGRDRIFQEVDEVVDANVHRLRELVYEEENRAHVEAGLLGALDALLGRTLADALSALPPSAFDALCAAAAQWACAQLRRPEAAQAASALAQREMGALFRAPLRDLLRFSGAEDGCAGRWAAAVSRWAAAGGCDPFLPKAEAGLSHLLLDTPLGRPSRLLSEGLVRELVQAAVSRLLPAVVAQVPEILKIVDVEGLIEKEVLHLEPAEVERVIVSVARRELGAIAWWGGVLGSAVVGAQLLIQRMPIPTWF